MSTLEFTDYRTQPQAWAQLLGISTDAVELYLESEVVDLHNDLYVPARLYGYNVHKRHKPGVFGAIFTRQTDLPRLAEAALACNVFDIATNPLRRPSQRARIALKNIARIKADLEQHPNHFRLVTNFSEYCQARADGVMGCYIGIQGGQAFQYSQETIEAIPSEVSRITLVHLTNSRVGTTSSPLGYSGDALRAQGPPMIEVMNEKRILVDLSHIDRSGFMHAVDIHDKSQPLIVTHTGVTGVRPHWRNIDDEQIRCVTDTGGTVGIIFNSNFLAPTFGRCQPEAVLDHMEHVISVAGEDAVSIGTDYDGMIIQPKQLREVTELPRLVQLMLDRQWPEVHIKKALGLNALRVMQEIRP